MLFINPTIDNIAMVLGYVLIGAALAAALIAAAVTAWLTAQRAHEKVNAIIFEFANAHKGTQAGRAGYTITMISLAVGRPRAWRRYSKRETRRFLWRRRRHNALQKDPATKHHCKTQTCFLVAQDRKKQAARKQAQLARTA